MAWQTIRYQLTSVCPMLMHNGQLANPANKWAKLMKQISSKRAKTDADHEEMARIEFLGGLYLNEQGPVIPANVIDATLTNAARKMKEGQLAKSGLFCVAHATLVYDGPRTANLLWADERFRDQQIVKVNGKSSILRTRPIFSQWQTTVELSIEDGVINPARVTDWMHIAGTLIGFLDWRPRYGRFESERLG